MSRKSHWGERTHICNPNGRSKHFKLIPSKKQYRLPYHGKKVDFPPGFYKFFNKILVIFTVLCFIYLLKKYLNPQPVYIYKYTN